MQVFVTGGSGALGRPTVRLLARHGHRVRALAHSEAGWDGLVAAGAVPVRGSLFDAGTLTGLLEGTEAVLHLATRIPRDPSPDAWAENDRIRTAGTRALVEVARASDVRTLVYPGVVFTYAHGGARWLDAESATHEPTPVLTSTLDAEEQVTGFTDRCDPDGVRRGVVLRMGMLYGPSSGSGQALLGAARRGRMPYPGPASAYLPLVWDEDAAAALVSALDAPSGVYDVVDDEPLTRAELAAWLTDAVDGHGRAPLAPRDVDPDSPYAFLQRSQRVSNARLTRATGWRPSVHSAREGLRRLAASGAAAG